MEHTKNNVSIQLDIEKNSKHFKSNFYKFNEILNLLKSNIDKEFTLKEIKDRIGSIKKWSEESLINNLYLLEETTILKVIIVKEYPIFKYRFELDLKKIETFLSMTEGCFELDREYTINEILELLNEVEIGSKNNDWDFLINYWETNILAFCTIAERKDKLIIERDKQKESYFADRNVLKFYCVHDKDKLSKDITDFRCNSKLPTDPGLDVWWFSKPLDILKYALEGRFKHWFQIQTLNYLIKKEENFKNRTVEIAESISKKSENRPPTLEPFNLEQSLILKKTDDLAVYRYFLGDLNIKTKINLDSSNISKKEYYNEIRHFKEKYSIEFNNKSVHRNAAKIAENLNKFNNSNTFDDEVFMKKILRRVKGQLEVEYQNKLDLIRSYFNKYKV